MKSSLFDTNVVSIYVGQRARKRHPEVVRLVGETLKTQGLYIATITMYELRRGVRKLRLKGQGRRKEVAVERLLEAALLISPDLLGGFVWNQAADLWAQASVKGVVIGDADLIIAATASAYGMELVTSDAKLVGKLKQIDFSGDIKLIEVGSETSAV